MADSKIVFGMCLLSVAFVALGSAQEIPAGDNGTVERRCPDTHPFAYDVGRQCCSTASGTVLDLDKYIASKYKEKTMVLKKWTTRTQAWDATSCEGESMYCHAQPGSDDYDEETFNDEPCENFKVECEADSDCADKDEGYGKCDTMNGVCKTMCTDKEFQCEVSKMCLVYPMKCNGGVDCANTYTWSWEDSSDEDTCVWCPDEMYVCPTEGETCVENTSWWTKQNKGWGACKKV